MKSYSSNFFSSMQGTRCLGSQVESRVHFLAEDGQAITLHIRIASGAWAGPDKIGRLFHCFG